MACEGPLAVTSADFPHLDGFVPGARKDHITSRVKQHVGNVVIVTEESLEALVVIVSVPDLDGQVGRTRGQISTLMIKCYVINGVCVEV